MKKIFSYLLVMFFIFLGYNVTKVMAEAVAESINATPSNNVETLASNEISNTYTEDEINENVKKLDNEMAELQKEQAEVKRARASKRHKKTYTKKQSYSGRCLATTKKGTQCRRNAASGSNYCWQHGG